MSDDGGAWVFGYGSLVCRPSLATYLGREPVAGRDWSVARLGGFRRLWNTAMDNGTAEPGARFWVRPDGNRPAGTVTYVGLLPDQSAHVNGSVFHVSRRELHRLDGREGRYRRADVTVALHSEMDLDGARVFAYLPRLDAMARHSASVARGTDRIARIYRDRVVAGFERVGPAFLAEYRATTGALPSPVEDLAPRRIQSST